MKSSISSAQNLNPGAGCSQFGLNFQTMKAKGLQIKQQAFSLLKKTASQPRVIFIVLDGPIMSKL